MLLLRDILQRGAADADLLLPCLKDLLAGLTSGLLTCCGGASVEVTATQYWSFKTAWGLTCGRVRFLERL